MYVMKITIPITYGQDAIDRCLDIGTEVCRTKRTITLDCTLGQLAEMKSDAYYYRTTEFSPSKEVKAICRSAKLALEKIDILLHERRKPYVY